MASVRAGATKPPRTPKPFCFLDFFPLPPFGSASSRALMQIRCDPNCVSTTDKLPTGARLRFQTPWPSRRA